MMGDPRQPFADALGDKAWFILLMRRRYLIHKVTLGIVTQMEGVMRSLHVDYYVYTEATKQKKVLDMYLLDYLLNLLPLPVPCVWVGKVPGITADGWESKRVCPLHCQQRPNGSTLP